MSKDDMPPDIRKQLEQDAAVYGNGYAEKLEDGSWRVIDPTKIRVMTNIVDYEPEYPVKQLSIDLLNENKDRFPGVSMGAGALEPCATCGGKHPDFVPGVFPGEVVVNKNKDQLPKLEELPKKTYHVDALPRKGIAGTISFEKKLDDQLKRVVYEGGPCPHCGSDRLITDHDDETFLPRVGCLDCNVWLTEVRFKGGE